MKDKRYGNPGALERTLALMGAKSLEEAIDKKKTLAKIDTASQSMDVYETMKQAIIDITKASVNFNFETMDQNRRKDLALMPMKDVNEINLWRDAWLRQLKK